MEKLYRSLSSWKRLTFWSTNPDQTESLLQQWRNPPATGGGQLFSRSRSVEIRRVVLGSQAVWIKQFRARNFSHILSLFFRGGFFGPSKSVREFNNLLFLQQHGVPAALPLAAGEVRRFGFLWESVLITRELDQGVPLDVFFQQEWRQAAAPACQWTPREWLTIIAAFTRRMHEAGFIHGDFFWRNLLTHRETAALAVIDCPEGKHRESLAEADLIVDLAALDAAAPLLFSRTQRLRFFKEYRKIDGRKLNRAEKQFAQQILSAAAPLRALQEKRFLKRGKREHLT